MSQHSQFGRGDATYRAVGEEVGIRTVVKLFYELMSSNPDYQTIRSWHPDEIAVSEDKLVLFLCAWTGGSQRYRAKYGPINIIQAHQHLQVGEAERGQWLNCMSDALRQLDYPENLVTYLLQQLWRPAERIRLTTSGG